MEEVIASERRPFVRDNVFRQKDYQLFRKYMFKQNRKIKEDWFYEKEIFHYRVYRNCSFAYRNIFFHAGTKI